MKFGKEFYCAFYPGRPGACVLISAQMFLRLHLDPTECRGAASPGGRLSNLPNYKAQASMFYFSSAYSFTFSGGMKKCKVTTSFDIWQLDSKVSFLLRGTQQILAITTHSLVGHIKTKSDFYSTASENLIECHFTLIVIKYYNTIPEKLLKFNGWDTSLLLIML